MKTKLPSLVLVFLLLPFSMPALGAKTQPQIDILTVRFALFAMGANLGRTAFDWLMASLSLSPKEPEDIPLSIDESVQARRALSTLLLGQEQYEAQQSSLYKRLQRVPLNILVKIALNPSTPSKVRFVARRVLRNRHIVPLMQQNKLKQLTKLARYFQSIAEGYGVEVDGLFDRLFQPIVSEPNPDKENQKAKKEPSLGEYLEMRGDTREAALNWFKKTNFQRRLKAIIKNYPATDAALQSIWNRIVELQDASDKSKTAKDKLAFIEITSELHAAICFYEALLKEERLQKSATPKDLPIKAVTQALQAEGKKRFPIEGSFDLQAIVMGFTQDAQAILDAEKLDVSDSSHGLKKGGGNRYILGNLIVSYDIDGHADGAYKLFVKGKNNWAYADTAIPVQVNNSWMLLCLNRNKKLDKNKWYLVDTDGQWWVLDRDAKDKMPEPTNFPF